MWKYFCGLCALFLLSCTSTSKEKTLSITEQTASRPDSFASDSVMLDYIQKVHFNYMWDGAEQTSGLAPERIHLDRNYPQNDSSVVTTGGSGFGIAGILVAIDRKFISREEGVARLHKIVDYLTRADRFHGVWPHWLDGPTGKVKPFGTKDDGGDLVESCLLCKAYFVSASISKMVIRKSSSCVQRLINCGMKWSSTGIRMARMSSIGIGRPIMAGK